MRHEIAKTTSISPLAVVLAGKAIMDENATCLHSKSNLSINSQNAAGVQKIKI